MELSRQRQFFFSGQEEGTIINTISNILYDILTIKKQVVGLIVLSDGRRSMNKRKKIVIALFIMLIIFLAGCGKTKSKENTNGYLDKINKAIQDYNESHRSQFAEKIVYKMKYDNSFADTSAEPDITRNIDKDKEQVWYQVES